MKLQVIAASLLALGASASCSKRTEAPRPRAVSPATAPAPSRAPAAATTARRLLGLGDSVPAIRVPAHDGSLVSLGDFRGKRVLLWFYPKASTPG